MDQPAATGDPGPRTPVLVGAGQASERLGQPGYQRRSPVALAADAALGALVDTRAGPAPPRRPRPRPGAGVSRDRPRGRRAAVRDLQPGGAGPAGPFRQLPP